jgi:hypothetical protein
MFPALLSSQGRQGAASVSETAFEFIDARCRFECTKFTPPSSPGGFATCFWKTGHYIPLLSPYSKLHDREHFAPSPELHIVCQWDQNAAPWATWQQTGSN